MGGSRPTKLDRLIESVARGERDLASIRDPELREAVRIALRLHKDTPRDMDDLARLRIRDHVLDSVRPRPASIGDAIFMLFTYLAKPAPYAVRTIALIGLVCAILAGAVVASADTLPEDALYSMKLGTEDLRLTLAQTAHDRAAVQLSIAEHRLVEAERLVADGRLDEALAASCTYSEQIAHAAADLAELDALHPQVVALVTQLDDRFTAQRSRLDVVVTRLTSDAEASQPATSVAAATGAQATALSRPARIAETAAGVAEHLVRVAERGLPRAETEDDRGWAKERGAKAVEAARRSAERARASAERAKAPRSGGKGASGR